MKLINALSFVGRVAIEHPWLKLFAGIFGAVLGYLFPTSAVQSTAMAVAALIVTDTITGFWAAYRCPDTKVSSRRFARLLDKLVGYLALCLVASVAARETPGLQPTVLVTAVLYGVMAQEGLSILENVHRMGLWNAPWLKKMFRDGLSNLNKTGKIGGRDD